MEDREEELVEPQKLLAMLKEMYQNFNRVLKEGSDGEKASAILKVNLLNGVFDEYVAKFDESHQIPTKMLSEELDKQNDIPQIADFNGKIDEIAGVLEETKILMKKHSPVTKKSKGNKRRGKIKRIFGE